MSEHPGVTEPADGHPQHPLGSAPAPDGLQLLPVRGLPEFRPGDDLVAAIAGAAPWIADGDVLVVTSKEITAEDRAKLHGCVTRIMEKTGFDAVRFMAEVRRALAGRPLIA